MKPVFLDGFRDAPEMMGFAIAREDGRKRPDGSTLPTPSARKSHACKPSRFEQIW
jgi:hypothetical protein